MYFAVRTIFAIWLTYRMARLLWKFFGFLGRRMKAWVYERKYIAMLAAEIRRDGGIR